MAVTWPSHVETSVSAASTGGCTVTETRRDKNWPGCLSLASLEHGDHLEELGDEE